MSFARFNPQQMGSGLAGFLGGMFGDSGRPYDKAMDQYQDYGNTAAGFQFPFYQGGVGAMGNMQNWLQGMKDPSQFINNLMSQYSQSPYAKNLQQQALNAAQNAGSANGLLGSTPFMQQVQQNAADISSQDMNHWLSNVLGINSQYGQGQAGLMGQGFGAAGNISNIFSNMGNQMGQAAYGKEAGQQQDFWNKLGGLGQIGLSFL